MAHGRCNCYFSFWAIFDLLPPSSPKNENFKTMKKKPEDTIILRKCTKSHDAILFLRYMVHDGYNHYFSFLFFLPFYPSNGFTKSEFQ